jgi:hypothetical protein
MEAIPGIRIGSTYFLQPENEKHEHVQIAKSNIYFAKINQQSHGKSNIQPPVSPIQHRVFRF